MSFIIHIPGRPRINELLPRGAVLWRYLDAAKFFDFLINSTLFFSRVDKLEDKFEGSFTPTLRRKIEESFVRNSIDSTYPQFKQRLRESVFVNCWHRSENDSVPMWRLYGKSECSVALTTTVEKLGNAIEAQDLPYEIAIEPIEYIKHSDDPRIDIAPYSKIFAYKEEAYKAENEVRVIIDRMHSNGDAGTYEAGISIQISGSELLRSIVIAPEAPRWFEELVRQFVDLMKLKSLVIRSELANDPI